MQRITPSPSSTQTSSTAHQPYRLHEFYPGRFHIIAPDGLPIYDDSPHGDDAPIILHDEDKALDAIERLNRELPQSPSNGPS